MKHLNANRLISLALFTTVAVQKEYMGPGLDRQAHGHIVTASETYHRSQD